MRKACALFSDFHWLTSPSVHPSLQLPLLIWGLISFSASLLAPNPEALDILAIFHLFQTFCFHEILRIWRSHLVSQNCLKERLEHHRKIKWDTEENRKYSNFFRNMWRCQQKNMINVYHPNKSSVDVNKVWVIDFIPPCFNKTYHRKI